MTLTAIGTAMLEVLKECDAPHVMWGDVHLLDEAFRRSGSKARVIFPPDRHQHVLNSLRRDARFHCWFVTIDEFIASGHYQKRHVRCFKLIAGHSNDKVK